ncbi:hypothetical protein FACS18948_6770 [Clostridia bacterium]|nr:hypothetical protein FACS18948_6770 [Clostridia bacterium]
MRSSLAAKLNTLVNKPVQAQVIARSEPRIEPIEHSCMIMDDAEPLSYYNGLTDVRANHVRLMNAPYDKKKRAAVDENAFAGFDIRKALFLDTETTGLHGAGVFAFLIGLGFVDGDCFVTRQILARNNFEEASMLSIANDLLADASCVVTFNGKSFDMPLVCDRFRYARRMYGLKLDARRAEDLPHIDLLHASRRIYKPRLGKCSLGNLEERVLGIERDTDHDIPGELIPERYYDYQRTGDFSLLEPILSHNREDVRSMARIIIKLAESYDEPESLDPVDLYHLGVSMAKSGETSRARACFESCVGNMTGSALIRLAEIAKQAGNADEAVLYYKKSIEVCGDSHDSFEPYVALAKLMEHRYNDARAALAYTRRAFMCASVSEMAELEKRRRRLVRKIEKGRHTY